MHTKEIHEIDIQQDRSTMIVLIPCRKFAKACKHTSLSKLISDSEKPFLWKQIAQNTNKWVWKELDDVLLVAKMYRYSWIMKQYEKECTKRYPEKLEIDV